MARSEIRLKRQRHFGARIAACRSGLRTLSNRTAKPKPGCADKWQRTNGSSQTAAAAALWIPFLSLLFQERIQAPKNAPIARFDRLGCYQSRSEKKAPSGLSGGGRSFGSRAALGFTPAAFHGAGLRGRLCRCGRLAAAAGLDSRAGCRASAWALAAGPQAWRTA